MPLPAIPVAYTAVASLIARKGAVEATKKYGRPAVKKAQEAIAKRQKAIDAKTLGKSSQPTKGSKARSAETNKVKARNKRLEEEMKGKERFDIDGDPLDEVPLRFDMYSGGLLSRGQYGGGALVKAILGLKKGATKATGRASEEVRIQKEFDSLMKEHNKDLGRLDELKKNNATDKQLTALKDKIRNDTEDLMMLEESLDAFKNYSPGGRRGESNGGLLSDDRQAYGFGGVIKEFIKQANKNKAKVKKDKSSKQPIDDSTDMAERGMVDMEDAIKMLDEGVPEKDVKMFLEASGYVKKDIDDLLGVYKTESGPQGKMTQDEIDKEYDRLGMAHGGGDLPNEGLEALHKKEPNLVGRMMAQEGGSMDDQMMMVMNAKPMESDNSMETNYTQFIMEEALTENEENMLVSKLEQDEELQMLFDKVIDVAQEFAGSGPVEGPGSGVSDSIPARLSDGEFVFTAKATEQIGEDKLMSMMKDAEAQADERQGFATGMKVGDTGEEEIFSNVDKTSVVNKGTNVLEEDEMSKNIKRNMNNPSIQSTYVRS